jgi:hypothetical protein
VRKITLSKNGKQVAGAILCDGSFVKTPTIVSNADPFT